jgi:hypothetical protein
MTAVLDWLWNNPIWWVPIVGFGGIGTFLAWRFLGWRGALAVLAATGAALFYGKTRRAGYESRVREEEKQKDELETRFREVESDTRTVDDAVDGLRARAEARRKRNVPKPSASNRKSR